MTEESPTTIPAVSPDPEEAARAIRRYRRLVVATLVVLALPVSALAGGYLGSQLLRNQLHGNWDSAQPREAGAPLTAEEIAALPEQARYLGPPRFRFDAEGFPFSSFEASGPAEPSSEADSDDETVNLLEPETVIEDGDSPSLFGTEDWAALDQIGDDPSGEGEDEETPPVEPAPAETFRVQVGAFEKRLDADLTASKLRTSGYAASVAERELPSGKVVFRVVVGPYASRESAKEAAAQLHGLGYTDAWVPVSEG